MELLSPLFKEDKAKPCQIGWNRGINLSSLWGMKDFFICIYFFHPYIIFIKWRKIMAKIEKNKLEKLVSLSKSRGIIFPGSEIYGGLANTWDYGPLGVEIKNNIKKAWWRKFIQESPYNVGVDAAILMNPTTWVASGHVGGFSDPLMDCKECKARFRADKLIEDYMHENGEAQVVDGWTNAEMEAYITENKIKCPECKSSNFTSIRKFNLMFKTRDVFNILPCLFHQTRAL